jgi:hypothetical protein
MSKKCPGKEMISNPSGTTSGVKGCASLSFAIKNLCLKSFGGKAPYRKLGSRIGVLVKAHSIPLA